MVNFKHICFFWKPALADKPDCRQLNIKQSTALEKGRVIYLPNILFQQQEEKDKTAFVIKIVPWQTQFYCLFKAKY